MSDQDKPWLVLSFCHVFVDIAMKLADELRRAHVDVRLDSWDGGGGAPAYRSVDTDICGAACVLALLTPSAVSRVWIGDEWKKEVFDLANKLGIPVLTVRGVDCDFPEFLADLSFSDLAVRDYDHEFNRLLAALREMTGERRIAQPADKPSESAKTVPEAPTTTSIVIELGADIDLFFAGDLRESFITELVPIMQDGLFHELGVPVPGVELRSDLQLPSWTVRILFNGVPETEIEFEPGWVMVNDRVEAMEKRGFRAKPGINPANGHHTAWIEAKKSEAALEGGLTVWDEPGFLILTLSALLRKRAASFVGVEETKAMLQMLATAFPLLVSETVPKVISEFLLTDILRRLVAEGESIRNLRRILMALAEWGRVEEDPLFLTEYVRAALKRQITHRLTRGRDELVVFLLHPDIEEKIREQTKFIPTGSYLDLDPDMANKIVRAIITPIKNVHEKGAQLPVILTTMEVRASIRRLLEASLSIVQATCYQELTPTISIQPLGRITWDGVEGDRKARIVSPWRDD